MKRLLVGHRGAGKTQLLKRHQFYFLDIKHFDLDEEIEKFVGQNLPKYFETKGEIDFRKNEIKVLKKLIVENSSFVIALGAGVNLKDLHYELAKDLVRDVEIVFVSRGTDKNGRIFFNRPRLEPTLDVISEYKKRFNERNDNFINSANRIYHMPEGMEFEINQLLNKKDSSDSVLKIEKKIFTNCFEIDDAYYTLSNQELEVVETLIKCFKKIELRTDLLETKSIQDILNKFPDHEWLVSVRGNQKAHFKNAHCIDLDCKFEYEGEYQIISSHLDKITYGIEELNKTLNNIQNNKSYHLKLCPLINNFAELLIGYNWQRQDPSNRSFLPRSESGKWGWYRQLSKYWQRINFVRSFVEVNDQPSVFEWLSLPMRKPSRWAAVLGNPIHYSRSPIQHHQYFAKRNTFFTKIELGQDEFECNIKFLIELGLTNAAVTSPLKEEAFKLTNQKSELSNQFRSTNTLYFENEKFFGENTDFEGFKELIKPIFPTDTVAIWGGGGTLNMMKALLPQAHCFSSQTGLERGAASTAEENLIQNYDYLIWAAPRSEKTCFPPENLIFKMLIDLNYTDNSMGLEFAAHRKIKYKSGIEMFRVQAKKQQKFWSQNECK